MFRIIRLVAVVVCSFLYFYVGFPEGNHSVYNMLVPPALAGAAVAMHFLIWYFDHYSKFLLFGLEVLFAVIAVLFVASTLPQSDGRSPLTQMRESGPPTRMNARDGLRKIGIDDGSAFGKAVLHLYAP